MTNEQVIKMAREQEVKFIKLWFTDILGFAKSFSITADELENALDEGMGFDGSSIQGFARIDESDIERAVIADEPVQRRGGVAGHAVHADPRQFRPQMVDDARIAVISAAVGYLLASFGWRWWIARKWRSRMRKRIADS